MLTNLLIVCNDGSEDAKHAIERAGAVFQRWDALVLTVWEPTISLGSFAWSGATAGMVDFVELDRAAGEDSCRIAEKGVRIAREAGLEAKPIAVKAARPVWKMIIETADRHQAAMVVMGSRGLTGLGSVLVGSVSSAVVHHAHRPTLGIPPAQWGEQLPTDPPGSR